jgi:hypothetical protein
MTDLMRLQQAVSEAQGKIAEAVSLLAGAVHFVGPSDASPASDNLAMLTINLSEAARINHNLGELRHRI